MKKHILFLLAIIFFSNILFCQYNHTYINNGYATYWTNYKPYWVTGQDEILNAAKNYPNATTIIRDANDPNIKKVVTFFSMKRDGSSTCVLDCHEKGWLMINNIHGIPLEYMSISAGTASGSMNNYISFRINSLKQNPRNLNQLLVAGSIIDNGMQPYKFMVGFIDLTTYALSFEYLDEAQSTANDIAVIGNSAYMFGSSAAPNVKTIVAEFDLSTNVIVSTEVFNNGFEVNDAAVDELGRSDEIILSGVNHNSLTVTNCYDNSSKTYAKSLGLAIFDINTMAITNEKSLVVGQGSDNNILDFGEVNHFRLGDYYSTNKDIFAVGSIQSYSKWYPDYTGQIEMPVLVRLNNSLGINYISEIIPDVSSIPLNYSDNIYDFRDVNISNEVNNTSTGVSLLLHDVQGRSSISEASVVFRAHLGTANNSTVSSKSIIKTMGTPRDFYSYDTHSSYLDGLNYYYSLGTYDSRAFDFRMNAVHQKRIYLGSDAGQSLLACESFGNTDLVERCYSEVINSGINVVSSGSSSRNGPIIAENDVFGEPNPAVTPIGEWFRCGNINSPVPFRKKQSVNYDKKEGIVYPNPFDDFLVIENNLLNEITLIELYNVQGKRLFQINKFNSKNSIKIDMNTYNSGIYFIKLYTNTDSKVIRAVKH